MSLALALLIALQPAPPAEEAEQPAADALEAEAPEDKLVCKRRTVEDTKFGKGGRTIKICKTRAEWDEGRRR